MLQEVSKGPRSITEALQERSTGLQSSREFQRRFREFHGSSKEFYKHYMSLHRCTRGFPGGTRVSWVFRGSCGPSYLSEVFKGLQGRFMGFHEVH